MPFPGYTAYCASKGGVRMMMRNLAMELAAHKINCNNIAPGAIATPINQVTLNDPEAKQTPLAKSRWGRFGKPEEVGVGRRLPRQRRIRLRHRQHLLRRRRPDAAGDEILNRPFAASPAAGLTPGS